MEAALKQEHCSLEDLLWEHCEYNTNLISLFQKYQKQVEEENRAKYDRATQRIVLNTICLIAKNIVVNSFDVFFDDFNKSLKMMLVFSETDLKSFRKEIYETLPKIQNLSIIHEGRDFKWNILSDKYLNKEMLEDEFTYKLKVINK